MRHPRHADSQDAEHDRYELLGRARPRLQHGSGGMTAIMALRGMICDAQRSRGWYEEYHPRGSAAW